MSKRTQGYQPRAAKPLPLRDVFSTGDVLRICRVSRQVVIREFDAGHLAGFVVPGSKVRRITRRGLLLWMAANNIPEEFLTDYREEATT